MKLYEFLQVCNDGFDCVDDNFDYTIYIEICDNSIKENEKDNYDKFIDFVAQNTDVLSTGHNTIAGNPILFVDFSKFVKENMQAFSKFADENCEITPSDYAGYEDTEIWTCLRILEDMAIGNYTESQYKEFLDLATQGAK